MEANAGDSVDLLLSVLDLHEHGARTTEDIFTGDSHPMPLGRVYGGQVLAQSLVAATRTLDADRVPHSLHGYFLRPGDASAGITFSVDRIHDGRSFSTRRTQAYQGGVPIFSMIASFQVAGPGLEHQREMPAGVPGPDELVGLDSDRTTGRMFGAFPIEIRPLPTGTTDAGAPVHGMWVRARRRLPADPAVHRAVLTYLTDWGMQDAVLRPHGVSWSVPGLKVASLDHALWFHREAPADEWLLYVLESPSARGGRGLATGRIYTPAGVLIASVAQEIMVRVPQAERDDER